MKSIKYLLPVAALALSGFATAGSSDMSSVVVRYGDLNLNSRAGVAGLHKRLRNAAESVCGNLNSRILGLNDAYGACVSEALANGVAAVGNPDLTDFHASKGKGVVVASN
ncbi:MAG TPA: UrcA family protein [Steroidobacteraceae bacterium]|nr:UrcA family protein [Steroidobacteraceae bacterium]